MDKADFLDKAAPEAISALECPTLNLAYLGDAVFELLARAEAAAGYSGHVDGLTKSVRKVVNAGAQSGFYGVLEKILTEDELRVLKRGRNAKSASRSKSATMTEYRRATGVETLFGYLFITNQNERLVSLFKALMNGSRDTP